MKLLIHWNLRRHRPGYYRKNRRGKFQPEKMSVRSTRQTGTHLIVVEKTPAKWMLSPVFDFLKKYKNFVPALYLSGKNL